jgi:hypothetical protein
MYVGIVFPKISSAAMSAVILIMWGFLLTCIMLAMCAEMVTEPFRRKKDS